MAEEAAAKQKVDNGFAPIKKEFLDLNHKPRLVADYLPQNAVSEIRQIIDQQNGNEPASKRPKLSGRNKKRPFEKRMAPSERLCPSIASEKVCLYGERCKFSHDVAKFFNLQTDSNISCYVFETYGRCPFGITCVFAGQHTDSSMKSIVKQELVDKYAGKTFVHNKLSKDLQIRLRKREYDFSRANRVLKNTEREFKSSKTKRSDVVASIENHSVESSLQASNDVATGLKENALPLELSAETASDLCENSPDLVTKMPSSSVSLSSNTAPLLAATDDLQHNSVDQITVSDVSNTFNKTLGCVTDEDVIRLRTPEKKSIDFGGKLYLAPLTTVGNLPFRRICKRLGADITCGEMAMSSNLLQGQQSEWALVKRHESETLFGVQLCGSFADTMTRTAQAITDNMHVDFIDINIGCPIDLVVQRGEGCALMSRIGRFEQIVKCIKSVINVPLTVKMRTGLQEDHSIAHTLLPKLAKWDVAMATVHGRSREQRYTKLADWQYIKTCVDAAKPMPIFGNGDIMSYMDYKRCLDLSGAAGCMIARGALIKPWVFTEIKEERDWDISATERFEIVKEFVNYGLEHWGSDKQGVASTRRFLLEWLSFLHRYIPVGLLERVPQRINERPPYYVGRSDLETLLASSNCADWIKISEMLLGPVPSDFTFLPKHRANSYQ